MTLWALAWAAGALLYSLLRGGGPYALVPALCWLVGGLVAGSGLPPLTARTVREDGVPPRTHPPIAAVALLGATTLGWAALIGLGALLDDVLGAVLYSYVALELVRGGVYALVAGVAGAWLAGRLTGAAGRPEPRPLRRRAALAWGMGAFLAQLLWLGSTFL
jgi:hypothetical protein